MTSDSLALCGAAGGVGTTRVTLEAATLLSRDGRDVCVLDAAYGTQGLADRLTGRIDPDMIELCRSETPLEEGLVDRRAGSGRLAVAPARAPFERIARGKSADAARRFTERIGEAERAFDRVLVDTPPVAANQAVAAVTGADRVAVVCDAARAADAVPRMSDRLADVGVEPAETVVTRTDAHPDADVSIPEFEGSFPAVDDDPARAAVAELLDETLSVRIDPEEQRGLLGDYL